MSGKEESKVSKGVEEEGKLEGIAICVTRE